MDFQEILKILMTSGLLVIGWFLRILWSATQELKVDLGKLREVLPIEYIRRDDFKEYRVEVLSVLHRIENKLDSKVDK